MRDGAQSGRTSDTRGGSLRSAGVRRGFTRRDAHRGDLAAARSPRGRLASSRASAATRACRTRLAQRSSHGVELGQHGTHARRSRGSSRRSSASAIKAGWSASWTNSGTMRRPASTLTRSISGMRTRYFAWPPRTRMGSSRYPATSGQPRHGGLERRRAALARARRPRRSRIANDADGHEAKRALRGVDRDVRGLAHDDLEPRYPPPQLPGGLHEGYQVMRDLLRSASRKQRQDRNVRADSKRRLRARGLGRATARPRRGADGRRTSRRFHGPEGVAPRTAGSPRPWSPFAPERRQTGQPRQAQTCGVM